VRLSALAPKQKSSPYAEEGTAAHEVAEICLKSGEDATAYVGKTVYNHKVTAEMAEAVQVYLDEVRGTLLAHHGNGDLLIEQRFKLDWIDKAMFGTNDASLIVHFDTLYVFDYKHGAGVAVEALGNKQMRYYALGAARNADVQFVEMVIVQPRCPHKDGPVRRERISIDDLIEWQDTELMPAVNDALQDEARLFAGDHCHWCPAKTWLDPKTGEAKQCPALRDQALAVAQTTFGEITDDDLVELPDPTELPAAAISKIMASSKLLSTWLAEVHKVAEDLLLSGEEVPDYKLVRGKANRRYKNEDVAQKAAIKAFGDKALQEPKLRSIAQLEKALGKTATKKFEAEYVEKPEGKISVAHASDKREPISLQKIASETFTPLD
jgi:hypothetical protein